jgi:hypothetical protein
MTEDEIKCIYGDKECEPEGGEPKQMCYKHEQDYHNDRASDIADMRNDLD